MSTVSNKHVLLEAYRAINDGRLEALEGHPGFWETRQVIPRARQAFADWGESFTNCQVAEGDQVLTYGASDMSHVGDFAGLAPTGRRVTIELFSLDQIVDGTVVAHNSTTTWPDVLRSIGLSSLAAWPARRARPLPPPAPPAAGEADPERSKGLVADLLVTLSQGGTTSDQVGIEEMRDEFRATRAAFPDLALTLVCQLAEGDLVATRATLRGTQRGPLFGIPASGRSLTWDHYSLVRVHNGAVVEARASADWTAAIIQLGIFPTTPAPAASPVASA